MSGQALVETAPMKKLLSLIAASSIVMLAATSGMAADIFDHELYKVVTYSYANSDAENGSSISKKMDRFGPMMITKTKADIIAGQPSEIEDFSFDTGRKLVRSFAVSADFHATPRLAFQGVIGVTKSDMDTSLKLNLDSSWEADVGVIYKLFNNFSYEMHFGFMDTGNLFKSTGAYKDVENIVMISNQLSMSF